MDPDSFRTNGPQKGEKKEISCFEKRDDLSGRVIQEKICAGTGTVFIEKFE